MTSRLPAAGAVLGIDVGWSKRSRTTCLCLLSWDRGGWRRRESKKLGTDCGERRAALVELVGDTPIIAVAIDGPLVHGLKQTTPPYRPAEALLSRGEFQHRGKAAQSSTQSGRGLHREATAWATEVLGKAKVARSGRAWALHPTAEYEAFPNAFLAVLHHDDTFPDKPTKKRHWTDTLFAREQVRQRLDELAKSSLPDARPPDLTGLTDHDKVAAYICALTALCVAAGRYVAVGDPLLGYIVLPPVEMWGQGAGGSATPWAETELSKNLPVVRAKVTGGSAAELWRDGRRWSPRA